MNKYFERTGENKQNYIDAIKEGKAKPVFTQEMHDNGELPKVGMECCFRKRGAIEKGTVTALTERFIIFTDSFGDEHVRKKDECTIEPLPKPIELEEKGLYLFDVGNKKELVGRAYHTAFEEGPMLTNLQTNTSYSVDCCTNIQQLFTKSELNKEEV
ncbi:MAG TPA: hypothetical protein EYN54_11730 [Methylococcaceae bacterium]|nr:hypothetical protein [Methylococcaceae bacterium]